MGQQYEILCTNNSNKGGEFCCFQRYPDTHMGEVMSLAWFARYAQPRTTLSFPWTADFCFVWGRTGELRPGVNFEPSQLSNADLSNNNDITLDHRGEFQFVNQKNGSQPGILSISETASIPMHQAAVGIGMSGMPTFVTQARPNMNLQFSTRTEYYVAFGAFRRGQVLDVDEMNNTALVTFPAGVTRMNVTLDANNHLMVSSSPR